MICQRKTKMRFKYDGLKIEFVAREENHDGTQPHWQRDYERETGKANQGKKLHD